MNVAHDHHPCNVPAIASKTRSKEVLDTFLEVGTKTKTKISALFPSLLDRLRVTVYAPHILKNLGSQWRLVPCQFLG